MNDLDLIALVAETNPYPAEGALPQLDLVRDRVGPTLGEPVVDTVPIRRRRRAIPWLVAAVAFAAVVLAIGAIRLLTPPEPDVVVPLPPFENPQVAAEAYYEALAQGGLAAYRQLWAPGAVDRGLAGSELELDKEEERFIFYSDRADMIEGPTCTPISDLVWECTMVRSVHDLELINEPSELEVTQRFVIDDAGRLTTASRPEWELTTRQETALFVLWQWIESNYPALQDEVDQITCWLDPIGRPIAEVRAEYLAAVEEYAATLRGEPADLRGVDPFARIRAVWTGSATNCT